MPITIAGTIGFMLAGLPQAELDAAALDRLRVADRLCLMAPVSSFTASYGARLAHALPKRWLEIGFGIFLLVVSVRFMLAILGH